MCVCRIVLYCIVLYRIVLYRIVSYCIVLYRIVSYCIVLYRIVSYCIVLFCFVLWQPTRQPARQADIHIYVHTYIPTYTYTCTHMRTYTHTVHHIVDIDKSCLHLHCVCHCLGVMTPKGAAPAPSRRSRNVSVRLPQALATTIFSDLGVSQNFYCLFRKPHFLLNSQFFSWDVEDSIHSLSLFEICSKSGVVHVSSNLWRPGAPSADESTDQGW